MCAIFMEQIHIEYIPEIGMRPMGITHYTCIYIPVHTVFFSLEFFFVSSIQCSESSFQASWIRIWICNYFHVSGSGSGSGSFDQQAKIFRITLIATVFLLLNGLLSLKIDVNVSTVSNKQKTYFLLASSNLKATDGKSRIRI